MKLVLVGWFPWLVVITFHTSLAVQTSREMGTLTFPVNLKSYDGMRVKKHFTDPVSLPEVLQGPITINALKHCP